MTAASISAGADRVELLVVAAVLVVPFLFALVLPRIASVESGGRAGVAVIALVTLIELPLAALAVWAVRRRGDSLSSIGIVRPHPAWVIACLGVFAIAAWLLWRRHTGAWSGAVSAAGAGAGGTEHTTWQMAALVLLGVPQIYLQELLYRGVAITFLDRATGSIAAAIAISSAAFALAHITSLGGNLAASLAGVFVASVLFSILYTSTRDVMPVFAIHWAWVAWLAVGLSVHTSSTADATPTG